MKIKNLLLSGFFSIFLSLTISCGANNKEETKWNISKDETSEVFAELIKKDNFYKLKISGKGEIKDFNNPLDVPWNLHKNEIKDVDIKYGITSIGKNSLICVKPKYIMIPASINSVETNCINDETAILIDDDEFIANDSLHNLYYYEEEINYDNDIYWQSDKTGGNIISNDYTFDYRKGYRNFGESEEPTIVKKTKILFIGNSFTYRNGVVEYSSGIPGIFNNIAEDLGECVETYSITGPGWYLDSHANASDTCGKQVDKILNACDDFDYVVLQEQSMCPFQNYTRFLNGVKALQQKINNTQKNAQIVLYETWGSPYSANEIGKTIPEMEKMLRDAYNNAASECNIDLVSPVGKAFTKVYSENPEIYLWASDNRHQGYTGAYLSACVHVSNIFGLDVRETSFKGESKYSAPTLEDSVYETLKEAAYKIVIEEEDKDYVGPITPEKEINEKEVNIACWGRFMKEAKFNELINDFVLYLDKNNIDYDAINKKYYVGATTTDPYYYIANFSSKIVADGGANIILPCADNFNANQSNIAVTKLQEINVYGQTNRRVGIVEEYALTSAFLDYVKTESGINILAKAD